jgi:hypothetical protein
MKIRKFIILISLMLKLRLKSLCIISSFVGREQDIALVEEYDKKIFVSYVGQCHEHLHHLVRLNKNYVDQGILNRIALGYF